MWVDYKGIIFDGWTSTWTANAVIISINGPWLFDRQKIMFKSNYANTSAVTIQVGDRTAVALKKNNDQALVTWDIELWQNVMICYNKTDNVFEMISQIANVPSLTTNSVTTSTITDGAVVKSKISYEVATVSIVASASGTATVTTGWEILGFYVSNITGTERVKTVNLVSTTITVVLTGSDTATVKVVVLKAT